MQPASQSFSFQQWHIPSLWYSSLLFNLWGCFSVKNTPRIKSTPRSIYNRATSLYRIPVTRWYSASVKIPVNKRRCTGSCSSIYQPITSAYRALLPNYFLGINSFTIGQWLWYKFTTSRGYYVSVCSSMFLYSHRLLTWTLVIGGGKYTVF